MKLLFWILEKLGRHEALVDAYGKIHWHRYYLFYHDRMENPRWLDYLPNAYIHVFEVRDPDGEDEHSHPWDSLGIVLKGGYTESVNHNKLRTTAALGFSYTKHTDSHRLLRVVPGTTTLFLHGWRKSDWKFHVKPHKVICDYCKTERNGVCYKKEETLGFSQYLTRTEGGPVDYRRNRTITWTVINKEFKKKWARRVKAAAKLGVKFPEKQEARDIFRDRMIEREKNAK